MGLLLDVVLENLIVTMPSEAPLPAKWKANFFADSLVSTGVDGLGSASSGEVEGEQFDDVPETGQQGTV